MSGRTAPIDGQAPLVRPRVGLGPIVALAAAVLSALAAGYALGRDGLGPTALGLVVVAGVLATVAERTVAQEPAHRVLRMAGNETFRRELDRSRRHRRSFALISLPFTATPTLWDGEGQETDGIAETTLRLLGTTLRITDAAWIQDESILVLLPESDRATAEAFLERARLTAPERFAGPAGVALFPDDGITSGALLDAARRGMHGETIPQPMAPTKIAAVEAEEPDGDLPTVGTETG